MFKRFSLVSEPTPMLALDPHSCSFCPTSVGPFIEAPLPASVLGRVSDVLGGAIYLCPDCFEALCAEGGVVSNERFKAVSARADEAETRLLSARRQATRDAETISRLERDLEKAEGRATGLRGERDSLARQLDELKPAAAAGRAAAELRGRIQASAVEAEPVEAAV